jgi:hypothetical protein
MDSEGMARRVYPKADDYREHEVTAFAERLLKERLTEGE